VRLLVKKPVGVYLRASSGRSSSPWTFVSKESRSCVPAFANRTPKDRFSTHYFIVPVARGPEFFKVRSITELCGGGVLRGSKDPFQRKRCHGFGNTQRNCGYVPPCVVCGGFHFSGGCCTPREQRQCCGCEENHTMNYRDCIKWKETKTIIAKQAPERVRKTTATDHPAASRAQRTGTSAEQMGLDEEWNHVVRGGRVVKATTTPTPNTNPSPQLVAEVPAQSKATATRKTARLERSLSQVRSRH